MAARRRRRRRSKKQRQQFTRWGAMAGAVLSVLLVANWNTVWPYLAGAAALALLGSAGWWLWRAHRRERAGDAAWRVAEEHRARELTMAAVDAMSWQEFETYVAQLCVRDGCTEVLVSGRTGDLGADVVGYLPDGKRLVVQCKHYAPARSVGSGDMQKFVGTARPEHRADVALYVTTGRAFTRDAQGLALRNDIVAIHRDLLGSWVKGATLQSLLPLNGSGGGSGRRPRKS
ncbi:restriction endonuclease (plasmid) [Streptomyces sp. CA-294286]|uniref:restriction endonuclease n=1 Tax=Streptomyces sp. CA-294286 TaxID=3240070 RepID=UPI003D919640